MPKPTSRFRAGKELGGIGTNTESRVIVIPNEVRNLLFCLPRSRFLGRWPRNDKTEHCIADHRITRDHPILVSAFRIASNSPSTPSRLFKSRALGPSDLACAGLS